ncbi:MAG: DUF1887 family protein [Erysipelotrichaceae bacterium]|nr:DUF1887 family protein [Erysipelotrichaceae bacterium]
MSKLLTVYDDKEPLNNVVSELTLDVDEVFYVYHHDVSLNNFANIEAVVKRYKDIPVRFIQLHDDEKQLKELLDENPNMIIDVGGAKYLSLLLFQLAQSGNNEMIYYDDEENVIKDYRDHKVSHREVIRLTIEDVLKLRGGEIRDYMHHSVSDPKSKETIIRLVEENMENYSAFIKYMSKVNSLVNGADYVGNNTYLLNEEAIRLIKTDVAYKNIADLFRIEEDRIIFKTRKLKEMVCVSGAFLENYLYIRLTESGYFDDVKMSAVIDFADDKYNHPVRCEIDCLIIRNNHLLFVSCKSSKADTEALNEIYVHNTRFGNALSQPVLCVCEELDRKYPSIYAKGEELNIYLVDKSSFIDQIVSDVFLSILEGRYVYDTLP